MHEESSSQSHNNNDQQKIFTSNLELDDYMYKDYKQEDSDDYSSPYESFHSEQDKLKDVDLDEINPVIKEIKSPQNFKKKPNIKIAHIDLSPQAINKQEEYK